MKIQKVLLFVLSSLCVLSILNPVRSEPEQELLKHYKGSVKVPSDLYETYAKFIKAIESNDPGEINKLCLPQSVSFTSETRPNESREYGQDMNEPFLKQGFEKYIFNVRKDGEGCYLLRTSSSAMWFIETKSMGWKLYRYLDKPIQ